MPTNTPRSIAEARPSDRSIAQACAEILGGGDDAIAIISRAREIDALATANGAEAGEAGVEAAKWAYQRRAIRSTGGRVLNHHEALKDALHAYALATRPQAASDGEAWIPVSGRLPEMDTPVWLHNQPTGDVFIGGRCDGEDGWLWCNAYASIYRDRDGWNANDMEADDDYPVTHWMPLPEPIAAMTTDADKGDAP